MTKPEKWHETIQREILLKSMGLLSLISRGLEFQTSTLPKDKSCFKGDWLF